MTGSGGPAPVRVLIADDQQVVREGLAMIIGLLDGVEVVGTAVDGADAVRQVATRRPDVVLMDLRMPGMDGVTATGRIVAEHPGTGVVVLTTYADDDSVFPALQAGARGYLTKDAASEQIRAAILAVAAGGALLDPGVQLRLVETLPARASAGDVGGGADPTRTTGPGLAGSTITHPAVTDAGLTPREFEVLLRIADGLSNTEIAARLVVSQATVKTHVNHVLAKTGSRDRAQLVAWAYRHGVVGP